MNRPPDRDSFAGLKEAFANEGLRGAVVYLNSQTDQRFTSLFRFDQETLRSVTFFDRLNPSVESCEDIPVEASYCVFVRDFSAKFTVEHAERDERVENHPKKATVQSYCGVPLLDRDGKMFGSICHFDFKPGRISDRDVEMLEYMARLIAKEL